MRVGGNWRVIAHFPLIGKMAFHHPLAMLLDYVRSTFTIKRNQNTLCIKQEFEVIFFDLFSPQAGIMAYQLVGMTDSNFGVMQKCTTSNFSSENIFHRHAMETKNAVAKAVILELQILMHPY